MQCPTCSTQLLHPANFCPVCGTRFTHAAGDAAQPGAAEPENVVYLRDHQTPQLQSNPFADQYSSSGGAALQPPAGGEGPPAASHPPVAAVPEAVPGTAGGAAHPGQQHQAPGTGPGIPVSVTLQPGQPSGLGLQDFAERAAATDFFSDAPVHFGEEDRGEPRIVGTMVALLAAAFMLLAIGIWVAALRAGAGGAEAGGFVLLSTLLWVWYLSMPRDQQHAFLLRQHARISGFIDRRVDPVRSRTEGMRLLRRERERYRAMRDERSRRVAELGESAYRLFRAGHLDPQLQPHAQRILAMEQKMLLQDARLQQAQREEGPQPEK